MKMYRQIVLITGGSGFLGQHLIRELQEKMDGIKEIRVVDLIQYENKIGHEETIPVKSIIGDIVLMDDNCRRAFVDVHTVFHCASYTTYEFPPDTYKLMKNNVEGTKNVIHQCLRNKVEILIYTSTAAVCIKPYFNNGFFSIIINQTESKELPPIDEKQLLFGSHAASKLKAEELVLASDNENHFTGDKQLRTIALRPTFMYGEEDNGLIASLMKVGKDVCNYNFWRIGGAGARHQFTYAGNVAWAHLRAKKVLEADANSIAGLPVFITDDTSLFDQFRFCEILTEDDEQKSVYSRSNWYIPSVFSFLLAILFEVIYGFLFKFIKLNRLRFSPRTMIVYMGSAIFFNRLRAIFHLKYNPPYDFTEAKQRCKPYYLSISQKECSRNNKIL